MTYTTHSFTTIDKGSNSNYLEARVEEITRIENWRALWQKHKPSTPVPDVDFSQYKIVAVFMGQQPSTSYDVEISNVEVSDPSDKDKAGTICLNVDYTLKGKAIDGPAEVQPHHIIQIPLMT